MKDNYVEERPWGKFEILLDADDTKVKRITIKPGGAPSYQYHYKRREVWILVSGKGVLKLNDKIMNVAAGETIFVDFEEKHQIRNEGAEDLVFIEVQLGTYFGEDDIVRIDDLYGRT
jgi:mannose-6-phosphate isomerase-like protein (cupin superfamily)